MQLVVALLQLRCQSAAFFPPPGVTVPLFVFHKELDKQLAEVCPWRMTLTADGLSEIARCGA